MPAEAFTRKANSPKKRRQWQHVYDSAKARGDDPGTAVRKANGVLKRSSRRMRRSRRR